MSESLSEPVPEPSDFEENAHQRQLAGWAASIAIFAALSFSAYQIAVAAFHPFSSLIIRSLHVSFLLLLIFVLYPARGKGRTDKTVPWYDALLALVGFAIGFYHMVFEAELIERSGDPNTPDLVIATIAAVLVFEAARRVMGWALPIVCGSFLAYGFFGEYLPLSIAHRGFGFDQIVSQLYLGSDGILGTPTLVSANLDSWASSAESDLTRVPGGSLTLILAWVSITPSEYAR